MAPIVRKVNAKVRKSMEKGKDLRSENLKKKAAIQVQRNVKQMIDKTRERALVKQEITLRDVAEAKEAKLDPDLQERIDLLVKKHAPAYTFLSPEEKAIIVELHHEGVGRRRISEIIGREPSTVIRFLQRYSSTTTASRMYFEANADRLARRVVKNANVDQSMEVLNRLDVLPEKDRKGGAETGPRFNVMIGVPGAVSAIPIPTQRDVEASRVTVVEEKAG